MNNPGGSGSGVSTLCEEGVCRVLPRDCCVKRYEFQSGEVPVWRINAFSCVRFAWGIDHDEHQPMNSEPVVGGQWGANSQI